MTRAEKRAANRANHVNRGARNTGSGIPASRIPAQGSSGCWASGPARGASTFRFQPSGDPESDAFRAMLKDPDARAKWEARAEEMRELMYQVATTSALPMERLAAADKLLDRIEGKPKATTLLGGAEDAGPVQVKVILEDLTTDAEPQNSAAASTAHQD